MVEQFTSLGLVISKNGDVMEDETAGLPKFLNLLGV